MAFNIQDLDIVDNNNQQNWPEGTQKVQDVNDAGRADEGMLARWFADWNGSKTTAGTGSALTLSSDTQPTAYYNGFTMVARLHVDVEPGAQLNVDSLGSDAIRLNDGSAIGAGDLPADSVGTFVHNGTDWTLTNVTATSGQANGLANSGFEVAQFGTSVSLNNTSGYIVDRYVGLAGSYNSTLSRVSSTVAGARYALRAQRDATETGTAGNLYMEHPFETEDAAKFAGRRITVSFTVTAGANFSGAASQITLAVFAGTGTERARLASAYDSETSVISESVTISTTATRQTISSSIEVPTGTTQLAVAWFYTPTGTAGVSDYFDIHTPQVQIGTSDSDYVSTSFQDELSQCQRLYQPLELLGINVFEYGVFQNADILVFGPRYHVQMRQTPTLITTGVAADYEVANYAGGSVSTCTSVPSISAATANGALVVFTSTGHGLTLGSTGRAQSTGSGTLAFDARL